MILGKLVLGRLVIPAITAQFGTYTPQGNPRQLTKIQDVGHVIPTPFKDLSTDNWSCYGTNSAL